MLQIHETISAYLLRLRVCAGDTYYVFLRIGHAYSFYISFTLAGGFSFQNDTLTYLDYSHLKNSVKSPQFRIKCIVFLKITFLKAKILLKITFLKVKYCNKFAFSK